MGCLAAHLPPHPALELDSGRLPCLELREHQGVTPGRVLAPGLLNGSRSLSLELSLQPQHLHRFLGRNARSPPLPGFLQNADGDFAQFHLRLGSLLLPEGQVT